MAAWVLAAEATYATTGRRAHDVENLDELELRARCAAGAIASRYLAVGMPRSFALIGDDPAIALSLEAHRTWFAPRDVRCTHAAVADAAGGRTVTLAEALASDIVCVHAPLALAAAHLRRGSHVNALAPITLDDDLARLARVVDEAGELPRIVRGLVDGRQLDELTIFLAGIAPT